MRGGRCPARGPVFRRGLDAARVAGRLPQTEQQCAQQQRREREGKEAGLLPDLSSPQLHALVRSSYEKLVTERVRLTGNLHDGERAKAGDLVDPLVAQFMPPSARLCAAVSTRMPLSPFLGQPALHPEFQFTPSVQSSMQRIHPYAIVSPMADWVRMSYKYCCAIVLLESAAASPSPRPAASSLSESRDPCFATPADPADRHWENAVDCVMGCEILRFQCHACTSLSWEWSTLQSNVPFLVVLPDGRVPAHLVRRIFPSALPTGVSTSAKGAILDTLSSVCVLVE